MLEDIQGLLAKEALITFSSNIFVNYIEFYFLRKDSF